MKIKPDHKNFLNININNFKGILIDIDDTLYSYQTAHLIALQKCFNKILAVLNKNLSFSDFQSIYKANRLEVTNRLKPHGSCRSRLLAFQEIFEKFEISNSYFLALEFEDLYWRTLLNNMTVDAEALLFLKKCKKLNLQVNAVTDMQSHIQIKKLTKLNLTSYIKFITTSEEAGCEKPDPSIFYRALDKMSLSPDQVIMIGDSLEKDIYGAESIGIKSYRVNL